MCISHVAAQRLKRVRRSHAHAVLTGAELYCSDFVSPQLAIQGLSSQTARTCGGQVLGPHAPFLAHVPAQERFDADRLSHGCADIEDKPKKRKRSETGAAGDAPKAAAAHLSAEKAKQVRTASDLLFSLKRSTCLSVHTEWMLNARTTRTCIAWR